ncbi:hypothetical protein [Microbacterium thalli]|uniref:hypothetical protein n=1 Tax=Microbacterium thalli TaxID=3027921 RepID=UPI002366DABC|nr:hypothetical protein [Microbacterium thalli]MDD7930575.1 hypothetical protein [Microbacterium thalli]
MHAIVTRASAIGAVLLLEQGKIDAETASRAKLSALGMMSSTVAGGARSSYRLEAHESIAPR